MNPLVLLAIVGLPMVSKMVSGKLQQRFVMHSRQPMPMTGAEIAHQMLAEHGITDVQVVPTRGQLTDHYDPTPKTVALSEVVYGHANVAACAVAAHECGHAVQHATNYPMLGMRSKMVPLLKLSNVAMPIIGLGGAGLLASQGAGVIAWAVLGIIALPTLFSLVTLPVEFNASRRALNWMESANIAPGEKHAGAKDALWWAAMTYVVTAIGSIAQAFVFAAMIFGGRRRR